MPTSTVHPTAPPLPSEVFITELGRARRRKDLTQQQLVDRLEAIGASVDRSAVGKIEAGKRGVSVDELFSFAEALGMSPLALVVPRSGDRMRVAPGREVATADVVQWARNLRPLPDSGFDGADLRFFYDGVTDRENAGYQQHGNLRAIVDLVGILLAMAGSTEPDVDKGYRSALAKLATSVQREWQDIGESGRATDPGEAAEQSLQDATAAVYDAVSKTQTKDG
jgi:transcriptional regulator with XRE-family HTH domain